VANMGNERLSRTFFVAYEIPLKSNELMKGHATCGIPRTYSVDAVIKAVAHELEARIPEGQELEPGNSVLITALTPLD